MERVTEHNGPHKKITEEPFRAPFGEAMADKLMKKHLAEKGESIAETTNAVFTDYKDSMYS